MDLKNERLEKIAEACGLTRKYFGCDRKNKPDCCCGWGTRDNQEGWHEHDHYLKLRIIESI